MTQAPTNLGLTPDAEARFDDYLRQVRAALVGVPDVSPDEIEADIREHVENELQSAVRPVALLVLDAVLNRLGPPTQWLPAGKAAVPAEFPSLWRYTHVRLRHAASALWGGPEDWRLPYLAFGTFALGLLTFPIFPLFLLVSYLLARAGIAVAKERGIELGVGRKWLLYPPLVIVSVSLLGVATIAVPLLSTLAILAEAYDSHHAERSTWRTVKLPRTITITDTNPRVFVTRTVADEHQELVVDPNVVTWLDRVRAQFPGTQSVQQSLAPTFTGFGVFTLWWAILGLVRSVFPGLVRAVFFPLYQGAVGRRISRVGVVCLALFAIWCGFAYQIAANAGLL